MSNKILKLVGDYAIIQTDAAFGNGINCYKADDPGGDHFTKINPRWSWFENFEAAEEWLDNHLTSQQRP